MRKIKVPLLYEDDYMFAVNKPPRVMSVPADHGIKSGSRAIPQKSVLEILQDRYKDKGFKPYLLHRLDMNTSGVMLFGKHEENRKELEGIFKDDRTKKVYLALLRGVPESGIIKHGLDDRYKGDKKDRKGEEESEGASADKVSAHTEFKVFKTFRVFDKENCALTSAEITTGRKHQIRQHFSHIGFPVVLDEQYGDPKWNRRFRLKFWLGRQFLHSERIEFFHPILKKTISIQVEMPPDLTQALNRIRSGKWKE